MGYRSEVLLAIAPEAAHAFMTLTAQNPAVMQMCHDADQFESGYDQKGDWLIYWSHIKWYDSYPEVAAIVAFIEALESEDLTDYGETEEKDWSECFKFIRCGEDMDDNESRGYGFENIHMRRSIDF